MTKYLGQINFNLLQANFFSCFPYHNSVGIFFWMMSSSIDMTILFSGKIPCLQQNSYVCTHIKANSVNSDKLAPQLSIIQQAHFRNIISQMGIFKFQDMYNIEEDILKLNTLSKIFRGGHNKIFFLFFSENRF